MDVVKWYTLVMEDGIDTKDLAIELTRTKEWNRKLEEDIKHMKEEHEKEVTDLRDKMKQTKHHLIK